ncbi:MAG: hypothetical protein QXI19_03445 [Candidatus Caldarchaeum sp.]
MREEILQIFDDGAKNYKTRVKTTIQLRQDGMRAKLGRIYQEFRLGNDVCQRINQLILSWLEEWANEAWNDANQFIRLSRVLLLLALKEGEEYDSGAGPNSIS